MHIPDIIRVVRVDDGVRAKLVCEICGQETYVRSDDDLPPSIRVIVDYVQTHDIHDKH